MDDTSKKEMHEAVNRWLDGAPDCTGETIEAFLNSIGYVIVRFRHMDRAPFVFPDEE